MGDQNTILSAAEARHLLRRSGFGAPPAAVQKILDDNLTRGQAADELLAFNPSGFKPKAADIAGVQNKWIKYMIKVKSALQEKLVLFWHDHFATSDDKVNNALLMALQNSLFRRNCKGNFREFMKAMNRNAALMEFLDTPRNRKEQPNENYARELMELFTLGVYDTAGNPNYLQEDIVQIARAFTGWSYDPDTAFVSIDPNGHDFMADYPSRGPKVIFKVRGGFGPAGRSFTVNGEGPAEIDAVVDILFDHKDTDGKRTVARRTARRLLEYFAHAAPDIAVIDAVVAASGFDVTWDVGALVRAILVHDAFYETAAPAPFDGSTKKSVKWPVDFVVSTLRLTGLKPKTKSQIIANSFVQSHIEAMGQELLLPPSVFGWDWEIAWLSTTTIKARAAFAVDVTTAFNGGKSTFTPEKLVDIALSDPGAIVDAVFAAMGVSDQFTSDERQDFIDYLTDDGAHPTINLLDPVVKRTKLNGLFALVIESPAYQLH